MRSVEAVNTDLDPICVDESYDLVTKPKYAVLKLVPSNTLIAILVTILTGTMFAIIAPSSVPPPA